MRLQPNLSATAGLSRPCMHIRGAEQPKSGTARVGVKDQCFKCFQIIKMGKTMSIECENERLIGLIYDAASDSRRWAYVHQALQQSFNADALNWAQHDFNSGEGRILDSIGYDRSYLRSYTGRYVTLNKWLQAQWYIPPGQVHLGEEILTEVQLVQTKFYIEWLKPQGLLHRICVVVKQEGQQVFYLEALRSKSKGPYDKQAKLFLGSLLPHLQQAMQRNVYFWRSAIMKDVIDSWPCALLAVDKHARPLFMNRAAEQIVHDQSIFCPNSESLSLTGLKSASSFQELIAAAASGSLTDSGYQAGEAMIIPRRNHRTPAWVVVAPLSRKLRTVVSQEVEVALVYIYLPEFVGAIQQTMLKTFFKLTPAEQKLAQLILEGCRLDEAAERLGITKNTARTHMKHIYSKTNTECQTDLVRLLLGVPSSQLLPDKLVLVA